MGPFSFPPLPRGAWSLVGAMAIAISLSSCLGLRQPAAQTITTPDSARGWALVYPELAKPGSDSGTGTGAGATAPDGATVTTIENSASSNATAPGMFDFSGMFSDQSAAVGGVPWKRSVTEAIAEARQQARPLLTLITHRDSKPAGEMENTLLRTPEFHEIASQFSLLRVDFFDTETRRSPLYQSLKDKLDARGYPTLTLSLPDGTEVLRLAGYKPAYHELYLKQLQAAVKDYPKAVDKRRNGLKNQGYRMWQSKDGRDIFARLTRLDANKASFINEWGIEFSTFTNRLSTADQQWIESRRAQAATADQ